MGVGFAGHFGKGKHRSHLPVVCCDPYFLQQEVPVEDFKVLDPHPTSFMGGTLQNERFRPFLRHLDFLELAEF